MTRKNRTPEENERRAKIRELLKMSNIGSMEEYGLKANDIPTKQTYTFTAVRCDRRKQS